MQITAYHMKIAEESAEKNRELQDCNKDVDKFYNEQNDLFNKKQENMRQHAEFLMKH